MTAKMTASRKKTKKAAKKSTRKTAKNKTRAAKRAGKKSRTKKAIRKTAMKKPVAKKKKAPKTGRKTAKKAAKTKKSAGARTVRAVKTTGKMSAARVEKLSQADKARLWHPFTQQSEWEREKPLIISHGKGNYLYDVEGNKYLDGVSSIWCTSHGHRVPEIDKAIRKQLGKVAHATFLGQTHEPGIVCAQKLVELAPDNLTRVFYSDSGSAAVEVALKMAFHYFQITEHSETTKTKFAFFSDSYHGDTLGAVAVGGVEMFHQLYRPLLPEHVRVDVSMWDKCARGDELQARAVAMAELEFKITRNAKNLAAVIIEPMMRGAGGMLPYPDGYLRRLRELCDAHNILLICDEVATGFGRTGKMFACEHEQVRPDLMAVGKALTGGYLPLSATLASEKVYDAFKGRYGEYKHFFHGHTFTANPLACAAAIASMELFARKKTLQNVVERAEEMDFWFREMEELPHVRDARRIGLMGGIEIAPNPGDPGSEYLPDRRVPHRIVLEARRRGVIVRPLGNVIVMMPPLSITEAQMTELCAQVYESISVVTGQEELFAEAARLA